MCFGVKSADELTNLGCYMLHRIVSSLYFHHPYFDTSAPDFSLPSNQGKNLGLKDFAGKKTVLYFYPGDFTSGCTIEAQGFERDYSK